MNPTLAADLRLPPPAMARRDISVTMIRKSRPRGIFFRAPPVSSKQQELTMDPNLEDRSTPQEPWRNPRH